MKSKSVINILIKAHRYQIKNDFYVAYIYFLSSKNLCFSREVPKTVLRVPKLIRRSLHISHKLENIFLSYRRGVLAE